MRVFISSVIGGMATFRDVAARAARNLGNEVSRAEDFGASPDSPQSACLAAVREAELVILLLGARYGDTQRSGLSATHEEYREAKDRCPVIAMVQQGVAPEPKQAEFIAEVQDWVDGRYTAPFTMADELLDRITSALHRLELSRSTGPVNGAELLERAKGLLPEGDGDYETRLAVAIAAGPAQNVLRPSQLEDTALIEELQKLALFGETAILTRSGGVEDAVEDDSIVLRQRHHSVSITEQGSIVLLTRIPPPDGYMPVIIEEDVKDALHKFFRFAAATLDRVDGVSRLSHWAVAVALLGSRHTWRTRAEHDREPHSVRMNMFDDEIEVVHLSPPHRARAALRQNTDDIVEDIVVKLRRRLREPRRR